MGNLEPAYTQLPEVLELQSAIQHGKGRRMVELAWKTANQYLPSLDLPMRWAKDARDIAAALIFDQNRGGLTLSEPITVEYDVILGPGDAVWESSQTFA